MKLIKNIFKYKKQIQNNGNLEEVNYYQFPKVRYINKNQKKEDKIQIDNKKNLTNEKN